MYAPEAVGSARELRFRAASARWEARNARREAQRLRERVRIEIFRGRRMIGRELQRLSLDDYVVAGDLADLEDVT